MVRDVSLWNHNTHFHHKLLRLLPPGESALDVGCGDGSFAALLAGRYESVMALDPAPSQVAETTKRCKHLPHVEVRLADFLTASLPQEQFDVVTALASFHHMPLPGAAAEAQRVLKPGGRLVVLGVWTDRASKRDLVLNLASSGLNEALQVLRGPDVMTAPATFDRTTWAEARATVGNHLPGVRLRRHLLWRYTLVWDKPTAR